MTAIYRYLPSSDEYDTVAQASARSDVALSKLAGSAAIRAAWRPIKVVVDRHGQRGDFPSFLPHVPVFTGRALDALAPSLGDAVEALPLAAAGQLRLHAIHVLDVGDYLDEARSTLKRFPSGGVMFISKYVFDERRLADRWLFRLSLAPLTGVFYTERFRRLVDDAGLKGLDHRQVFP